MDIQSEIRKINSAIRSLERQHQDASNDVGLLERKYLEAHNEMEHVYATLEKARRLSSDTGFEMQRMRSRRAELKRILEMEHSRFPR